MNTQVHRALTQTQTASFLNDGFLALDRITSMEEVESLKPIFERLFERRVGRELGMHYDMVGTDEDDSANGLLQIMSPSRFVPSLLRTEIIANARSLALQILGSRAEFQLDHALLKPAHSRGHYALAPGRGLRRPGLGSQPGQLLDPAPGSERGERLSAVHSGKS